MQDSQRTYIVPEETWGRLLEMSQFQSHLEHGSCVTSKDILVRCVDKVYDRHKLDLRVFMNRIDSIFTVPPLKAEDDDE